MQIPKKINFRPFQILNIRLRWWSLGAVNFVPTYIEPRLIFFLVLFFRLFQRYFGRCLEFRLWVACKRFSSILRSVCVMSMAYLLSSVNRRFDASSIILKTSDCLIYEMLYIKPWLNVQSDSIRAKLYHDSLMMSTFTLILAYWNAIHFKLNSYITTLTLVLTTSVLRMMLDRCIEHRLIMLLIFLVKCFNKQP